MLAYWEKVVKALLAQTSLLGLFRICTGKLLRGSPHCLEEASIAEAWGLASLSRAGAAAMDR